MKDELVSIIIPTYKTNNSLKRAINSVLTQDYKNIEVIVVDDNGINTEGNRIAKEIIKEFNGDSRIKYIEHIINKNGSAARNTGVKYANGKYVGFLDDDDYFFKNKISFQLKTILNNKCDLCTCYYYLNGQKKAFKDNYIHEIFMLNQAPQTSSFLMKKKFFEELHGFDETYNRHQDYEFLLRACEKGVILNNGNFLYERLSNGVNNIPDAKKLELIKNKFLKQFEYLIIQNRLNKKKIYAKNYATVAVAYLKQKDYKNMFRILSNYKFTYHYFIKNIIVSAKNKIVGKVKK